MGAWKARHALCGACKPAASLCGNRSSEQRGESLWPRKHEVLVREYRVSGSQTARRSLAARALGFVEAQHTKAVRTFLLGKFGLGINLTS